MPDIFDVTVIQAMQRIDAEVQKRHGFSFRADGMLNDAIVAGEQFMLVRVRKDMRADPILAFQINRNIVPGAQHFGVFAIPENNPDSRIIVPSNGDIIATTKLKV